MALPKELVNPLSVITGESDLINGNEGNQNNPAYILDHLDISYTRQ